MKKYSIAIAGTTKRTTLCAESLLKSDLFEISWILTPKPKAIGRDQVLTPNSLDLFADANKIHTIYIDKQIDGLVKEKILKETEPDFILVVDFGYIVPDWLLKLPKIAPLNIHPSELPKWRGSSPGQYSILFDDKRSAITLMVINQKFDQGPIIHQDFFDLDPNWNQTEYYLYAFELMCNDLDKKIANFGANPNIAKPQPEKSPTLTAKMLKKDMTFVEWEVVKQAMGAYENFGASGETKILTSDIELVKSEKKAKSVKPKLSSKLLSAALEHNQSLAVTLERASKAFNPWPYLWTLVPTSKGEKRMKLLELEVDVVSDGEEAGGNGTGGNGSGGGNGAGGGNETGGGNGASGNNETGGGTKNVDGNGEKKLLILKIVHIEGKTPGPWNEVKNSILKK